MSKNTVIKDIGAIICGVICLVRGIWYSQDIFRNYSSSLYCFPPPNADWYNITHFILCLAGIILTVWRFFRKGKGLPYKEYEWIPLIISVVFFSVLAIWALITPWDI